ncbi:MAG: Rpn family recombination-promoting nuclease/putative transposase, partial [Gammaproteobacteria bacterium]|nr:Rpn family recombination-promoting nuclease/putative transposase [Gammaproteobacteria bacterium]
NPVIAITFTDFRMFEEGSEHLSRFRLIERERFIEYSDDVELIFIELPKFSLGLEQLHSIQDKWIYFVKNAGSLEYIPDSLGSDPCIHAAFDKINEAAMTREELEIQHKRHDFIILQRGSLELAEAQGVAIGEAKGREEGKAEGRAEGKAEGEHQAKLAIARNLLDVLDDATVAVKTGLGEEEVRRLRLPQEQG